MDIDQLIARLEEIRAERGGWHKDGGKVFIMAHDGTYEPIGVESHSVHGTVEIVVVRTS